MSLPKKYSTIIILLVGIIILSILGAMHYHITEGFGFDIEGSKDYNMTQIYYNELGGLAHITKTKYEYYISVINKEGYLIKYKYNPKHKYFVAPNDSIMKINEIDNTIEEIIKITNGNNSENKIRIYTPLMRDENNDRKHRHRKHRYRKHRYRKHIDIECECKNDNDNKIDEKKILKDQNNPYINNRLDFNVPFIDEREILKKQIFQPPMKSDEIPIPVLNSFSSFGK